MRLMFTSALLVASLAACASQKANTWRVTQTFHENAAFVEDGETDPQVLEDAGPTYDVDDCLTVKMGPEDGPIYYSFLLNFPFEHECSMSGMAEPAGPNLWVQEFPLAAGDGEEGGMCRLELRRDGDTWTITDGADCRSEFCGARGSIDGYFPASTKGPLGKCGYGN
jgi:hypothetical protein